MSKSEFGFSNFKKLGFVKKAHLVSVAVLEQFRNNGIGSALVEESIKAVQNKQCNEFYLEVRCSNNKAVKLYERLGFIIKQKHRAYYRDGEDAYMMAIEF
jgi:ribosomal-protein-alanine N-acetyltransferase